MLNLQNLEKVMEHPVFKKISSDIEEETNAGRVEKAKELAALRKSRPKKSAELSELEFAAREKVESAMEAFKLAQSEHAAVQNRFFELASIDQSIVALENDLLKTAPEELRGQLDAAKGRLERKRREPFQAELLNVFGKPRKGRSAMQQREGEIAEIEDEIDKITLKILEGK